MIVISGLDGGVPGSPCGRDGVPAGAPGRAFRRLTPLVEVARVRRDFGIALPLSAQPLRGATLPCVLTLLSGEDPGRGLTTFP
jgi:hypothetical protein